MHEMHSMRAQGVEIDVFSLHPPKHTIVHEQARELLSCTHYSPFLSWQVIKAQFHFLRRCPSRYRRALAKVIRQTWREPVVLLRALAIFPKSIYFAQQIAALEINHIHAHFVWLGGIAAGVAADLLDITFTVHPHAFGLFGRNQRDVRTQLENASRIVTISSHHAEYIAGLCPGIGPESIEIIHLGVETDYFRPASKLPDGKPIRILSIGRLIRKKGHEYLIDACRLLSERGVDFQCQIAGDGPCQQVLQTLIEQRDLQDRVTLLGAVEQAKVLELYQTCDIFALPCVSTDKGDQDGMPYVLIEAMACEVPVITTPLSGIPDLVHDGETGMFVEERDTSGLANALGRLIVDEDLRRRLGTQARQTVLKEYQVRNSVARLAALFRQVSQQY